MDIIERLTAAAKAHHGTLVLPEGDDPRIVAAARRLDDEDIAHVVVLDAHAMADDERAEAYAEAQRRIPVNTRTGNLLRLCAVTVPAGFANGLPVGLMVYGRPNQDRYTLRVARAVELALNEGA